MWAGTDLDPLHGERGRHDKVELPALRRHKSGATEDQGHAHLALQLHARVHLGRRQWHGCSSRELVVVVVVGVDVVFVVVVGGGGGGGAVVVIIVVVFFLWLCVFLCDSVCGILYNG